MNSELNMILKAKVVKLLVELDYKNSNLPAQVNRISRVMKKFPVRLTVQFDASQNKINKEMNKLRALMRTARPLKVHLDLDTAGSQQLKAKLNDVTNSIDRFNRNYKESARTMTASKKKIEKAMRIENVPTSGAVKGFNNIKQYATQMKEIERIMRSKVPDGKGGIFSTRQFKDAQGNMTSFIATLKRTDGIVESIRYKWNSQKNAFTPVSRSTMDKSQANINQVRTAILNLTRAREKDYIVTKSTTRRNMYDQMIDDVRRLKLSVDDARVASQKMANEVKRAISYSNNINKTVVGGATAGSEQAQRLKKMIDRGDLMGIQKWIEGAKGMGVQAITTEHKIDKLGRSISVLNVKMASTGKQARTFRMEMNHATGAMHQVGLGSNDFNANRNMGIFEQLRVAMTRVPVWMAAMTAFYGSIRAVRSAITQIIDVDKAMTEIRRVASDNINVDAMFDGSVKLSKELGNNLHDILGSVGELARTFGEFNERQLLAITRTATLMANVSDLNTEEAAQTLVGTMNAFNIEAEESIRIVDALNEVDNNYAINEHCRVL